MEDLMDIQTPSLIWMKFCTPPPPPSGPGGSETLKAEEYIFENCLQNKRCLASCK